MKKQVLERKKKLDEFYELIKSYNEDDKFVVMKWKAGNNTSFNSNDNISVTNEKIGDKYDYFTKDSEKGLLHYNYDKSLSKFVKTIYIDISKLYLSGAPCTVCTSKVYIFRPVGKTGSEWHKNVFYKENEYILAFFKEPEHYRKNDIQPIWIKNRMQSLINQKLGHANNEYKYDD
jgi:hypothetical protein